MLHALRSRYLNGGAPQRCAQCRELFDGEAHRGISGAYYCSPECRIWNADDLTEENAARRVN
jgi:hypothetical protein